MRILSGVSLICCGILLCGAASVKEADQLAAKGKYREAIDTYTGIYYSEAPIDERIRSAFQSVDLQRKIKEYNQAHDLALAVTRNDAASPEVKAKAYEIAMNIALKDLNNLYSATVSAGSLLKNKAATEAQKKAAQEILDACKRKKNTADLTPEEKSVIEPLKKKIRKDHPRIFFNKETFPLLVKHFQRADVQEYYKKNVRPLAVNAPDDPKLWTGKKGLTKTPDSRYVKVDRPDFYGTEAAACALVYLLEGDKTFLPKAIRLLEVSADAVDESYKAGVLAGDDYYSNTVLYALAAYDWLWNEMTPEQRQKIGKALMMYSFRSEKDGGRFVVSVGFPEAGGFYGIRMLKWFAGLTVTGDGIDETIADKLLYEGYRDHEIMLHARNQLAGDDGGLVSTANNYSMATYLWSTYNYLSTWQSAFGEERGPSMQHLRYFPQWAVWSMINGTRREWKNRTRTHVSYLYDFGCGDTGNTTNEAVPADLYLYEILHFIPKDPVVQRMVMSCISNNPLDPPEWPNLRYRPLTPMLRYNLPPLPAEFGRPVFSLKSHARFFENFGIIFMRSGSAPGDTYAEFVTNKKIVQHRHYDANSFAIYKYDFLALDTGTRIGFQRDDYEHLNAYYAQTVAHNTILIHMPEEEMPHYWVTPRKRFQYFSHGGQERTTGDRCVAYETGEFFTYAAGDAAPVYSAKKCKTALRQFVFVYPDIFVIADRVTSVKPEYRKEWLLHSQNEPVMLDDRTFRFDDGGGRLFCKTLLPKEFRRTVVGGEGKEFFASGKNWELPEEAKQYTYSKNYLGRYRTEIAPAADRDEEYFLHVIQVGKDSEMTMIPVEVREDANSFGAEFSTPRGKWNFSFGKKEAVSGHVKLMNDGQTILDRPLRKDIQPQVGLD